MDSSRVLLLAAALAASGCPPEPPPALPERCAVALSAHAAAAGTGASAKKLADTAGLPGGEAATGRAGDYLLENGVARFVIGAPDRRAQPNPYGGGLVDAALPGGEDAFGELGPFLFFGRTIDAERVEIVSDGSKGGAAVVAATGKDTVNDYLNLPAMLQNFLPGLTIAVDSEKDYKVLGTTYYVLNPGEPRLRIVTAICNGSDAELATPVGDLLDSGGELELFNPGNDGFGVSAVIPTKATPYFALLARDVAYGYVPPTAVNSAVTISGVTGILLGARHATDFTSPIDREDPPPGTMIIPAGGVGSYSRDFVVGRDLAAVSGEIARLREEPRGPLHGRVTRAGTGEAVAGARVAALGPAGLYTVFTADADGRFSAVLPLTTYHLSADDGLQTGAAVTVAHDDAEADPEVALFVPEPARVVVNLRDTDGGTIPGKITVLCSGDCPSPRQPSTPARYYRDVRFDGYPAGTQEIRYVGVEGSAELRLPAGTYTLAVSRGPEWSLAKKEVTLGAGANEAVTLAIAHVVETPGWASADLHVHAINSPDSPVPNRDRIVNFLAEGVDLIVSTDHDYITDYAPAIAALGAGQAIGSLPGVESTPMDFGHFNGYPLSFDRNDLTGGAPDWAGGRGATLTPQGVRSALEAKAAGSEVVTQINHARGGQGYFSAIGLDTATLETTTDPRLFRMDAPATEGGADTGLFDRGFTAMEIMNGWIEDRFHALLNDWFAFLNRGVLMAATAVSDTHGRHGRGGHPRTWVRVGVDAPALVSGQALGAAVNDRRAVGGTAPFVTVVASSGGASAEVGDRLPTSGAGAKVEVAVRVQAPEWAPFNKVQLFVNTPGTTTPAYEQRSDAPTPQVVQEFTLGDTDRVEVAAGHRRWDKTVVFSLAPQQDAWVAAVVRGSVDLYPVVGKGGARALAFTNPILIDVGADGWSAPVKLSKKRGVAARPVAEKRWVGAEEWEAFLRWVEHGQEETD
jgi:hypothetical protein